MPFTKNEKWGNSQVGEVADMGTGDICVSCGYFPKQNLSYVAFNGQGTGEVGEAVPGFDKLQKIEDSPIEDINFAIRFSSIASIDVVIEKLEEAKAHLHRMELEK